MTAPVTLDQTLARIRETFGVEPTGEDPKRPLDVRHLTVSVPVERWAELARFAKEGLGCRYFCHLTAVDWKADGFDVVAEAGVTAVIQPGGSLRDNEVIAAADERGIAMVFTGLRHFRH